MSKRTRPSGVLAIVPARGGSKGIPRKNLRLLNGKPLVWYSIAAAMRSNCVTRVVVSTDDPEIADVSRQAGADVPFLRPAILAGDRVLDWPVFEHALKWLQRHEGYQPACVVHLRPTAPLRMREWIDDAVKMLTSHPKATCVRSVSEPNKHPYRMFTIGKAGYLRPLMSNIRSLPYLLRRQELPTVYYYDCIVDVTRPSTIERYRSMTGPRMLPLRLPSEQVIDIDSFRDLEIAGWMLKTMNWELL